MLRVTFSITFPCEIFQEFSDKNILLLRKALLEGVLITIAIKESSIVK